MRRPSENLSEEQLPTGNDVTPRLGISMGDPVGVGPEVIVRALNSIQESTSSQCIVFGDAAVLRRYALPHQEIIEVDDLSRLGLPPPSTVYVKSISSLDSFLVKDV